MSTSINSNGFMTPSQVNAQQQIYQAEDRTPKTELGKDEFLQLLAVQMSNQDPLEPMQDTDFIAQMAQFTSLEQMQQLNQSFGTQQAYTLIGKNVVGEMDDHTQVVGTVTGVMRQGKTDYLQIGTYKVPLANIKEIYDPGTDSNSLIAQSSHLVGKRVEASVPTDKTDLITGDTFTAEEKIEGVVESILVKNFTVYAQLKTATGESKEVPVAYITKITDSNGKTTEVKPEEGTDSTETDKAEEA